MKLFQSIFLLIALLALTQAVQAQNNGTFSLDRTKPIRELDTVRFDPQPYTKMDRKLELYNHISSFGHMGVFVCLGNLTQLVNPLFTRIPARREFERFTTSLEGRPIYGLNQQKMRDFSYNLAMADYEFRQIRTTNYIALGIGVAGIATGASLFINGWEGSNGGGIFSDDPGFWTGGLILLLTPAICIQIPPMLNRARTTRIQNYMYNARMIQESGMYQK